MANAEPTGRNDYPDEPTEERTVEWNLDALGDEIVEIDAEGSADASGRAVVAKVIEDGSTGAGTSRERAVRRARRDTVPSLVPSILAKSMRPVGTFPGRPAGPPPGRPVGVSYAEQRPVPASALARDPAAPAAEHSDVTRRVVDADDLVDAQAIPAERQSGAHSVETVAHRTGDVHSAPTAEQAIVARDPVALLVQRACSCLDAGDVAEAVLAASDAIAASEERIGNTVGDLGDTASGPLARIFSAGPISKVPVTNRSDAELDNLTLDEVQWALLRRMNGRFTFNEVFRATKIPAIDALKIAASLLRNGVIRVEDRARARDG